MSPQNTDNGGAYMSSVTQRIADIKQPKGGYLKLSQFDEIKFDDGIVPSDSENVESSVVGATVKYLTRLFTGVDAEDAFSVSMLGARIANTLSARHAVDESWKLIRCIHGLDEKSIVSACKLATFDVWHKSTIAAAMAKSAEDTIPDRATVCNIETMVNRSISLFEKYGKVVDSGFDFSGGGYTPTVKCGDGDFLTSDMLLDFRVAKTRPNMRHTLQVLMHYVMSTHSVQDIFSGVEKIGIFNPRQNILWVKSVSSIASDVIKLVESDVLCY